MSNIYTFYDYVDAGGSGENIINGWLNGDGRDAKAYFNRLIGYLEASPPPSSKDTVWQRPYTWPLRGEWKGFIEIRKKVKGLQYRLIGKMEVRDVLLVTWGYHRERWETDIAPHTALIRLNQMLENPEKYRRKHDNR